MEQLRRMLSQLYPLVTTIAGVYLLVCVAMFIFQDALIFFPRPISPGLDDWYTQHEVEYASGPVKLKGWFIDRGLSDSRPLIVYYGGNAEDITGTMGDFRARTDLPLLFVPYRGFGSNPGKPSQKALQDDALAILDQVVDQTNIDSRQIIVVGRSLGSGVAAYVASKRPLKGVILITPFDSLTNVAQRHYPFVPVSLLLRHRFNSAALAGKIDTPMLMLIGGDDTIVDNEHSNKLFAKWAGKRNQVVLAGADHIDITESEIYWEAIDKFLFF